MYTWKLEVFDDLSSGTPSGDLACNISSRL